MPVTPNVAAAIFANKAITLEKFLHTRDLFNNVRDKCKSTHLVCRSASLTLVDPFLNYAESL